MFVIEQRFYQKRNLYIYFYYIKYLYFLGLDVFNNFMLQLENIKIKLFDFWNQMLFFSKFILIEY